MKKSFLFSETSRKMDSSLFKPPPYFVLYLHVSCQIFLCMKWMMARCSYLRCLLDFSVWMPLKFSQAIALLILPSFSLRHETELAETCTNFCCLYSWIEPHWISSYCCYCTLFSSLSAKLYLGSNVFTNDAKPSWFYWHTYAIIIYKHYHNGIWIYICICK